jgi:hypothetical protein
MGMCRRVLIVAAFALFISAPLASADHEPTSDAEYIPLIAPLTPSEPGWWWDHAALTAAVRGTGDTKPEYVTAAREGLELWRAALQHRFDGAITLTDVTDAASRGAPADIVVHLVPHAGGVRFAGYAKCGADACRNAIVRYEPPPGSGFQTLTADDVRGLAVHEVGHALGLSHAQPLFTTNDAMGYGWFFDTTIPQVISQCDMRGLEAVFAWVLEGVAPHPPTVPQVTCA